MCLDLAKHKFSDPDPVPHPYSMFITGIWIRFWPITGSGALYCTSKEGRLLKFYWMNIIDNFKSLFSYFWCKTSPVSPRAQDPFRILPDPGWFSDSRHVWHLNVKSKKKAFKIIYNIHSKNYYKSIFVWGKEPRVRFLAKTGSSSLFSRVLNPETLLGL